MSALADRRTDEQVELQVVVAGELTLPPDLLATLQLTPGELIAIESGSLSIRLDLYRDFLDSDWEGLSEETARRLVEEYLCRPLTAVLSGGRLPIPCDVLSLGVGDKVVLQVRPAGLHDAIFLFRASAAIDD